MEKLEAIEILDGRHISLPDGGFDEFADKVNEAIDIAIDSLRTNWKYVHKDGNPEHMGEYFCMLVSPTEYEGKTIPFFEYDTRYFGEAEKYEGWIMDGQPDNGLVWTEGIGSALGEKVYAWHELPETDALLDMDVAMKMIGANDD